MYDLKVSLEREKIQKVSAVSLENLWKMKPILSTSFFNGLHWLQHGQ